MKGFCCLIILEKGEGERMEGVITAFVMMLGVVSVYIFANISIGAGLALFILTVILIDFFYRIGLLTDEEIRR